MEDKILKFQEDNFQELSEKFAERHTEQFFEFCSNEYFNKINEDKI